MSAFAKKPALVLALLLLASPIVFAHESHRESTFDVVVENYLTIQTALAGDNFEGIAVSAGAIAKSTAALAADFDARRAGIDEANADSVIKLLPGLQAAAEALSRTTSLKAARAAFGDLSDAMVAYRNLAAGDVPQVAYCGMAKQSWLQYGKDIANPYYGSSMLRCGSIVEK